MAEKPFTGLTACVKVGSGESAKTLAYISGVDLNLEKDIIEILAFGMTYFRLSGQRSSAICPQPVKRLSALSNMTAQPVRSTLVLQIAVLCLLLSLR